MEAYREMGRKGEDDDEDISSNSLLFVGNFTVRDINSAFDLDWQQMSWGWLGIEESDAEVREIKLVLRKNYGLICKIFSHYCGNAKVGDAYGMSMHEFGHFIHATGAVNYKTQAKKLESIFISAIETQGADSAQMSVPLMTRIEFVYGVIKVALRSADDAVRNVIEPIDSFISGPVDDTWAVYLSKYRVYNDEDTLLHRTLEEYYDQIKFVFNKASAQSR
ncbi:unnamed protein product, partial [Symbiodinium microadriaticum]